MPAAMCQTIVWAVRNAPLLWRAGSRVLSAGILTCGSFYAFGGLRPCVTIAGNRTVQLKMSELPKPPPLPLWLRCLPGLALFRSYRREWLRADVLAGVSV